MSSFRKFRDAIIQKKSKVCVVGLGYIGFPTALFYLRGGYHVEGIDLNKSLVENLRTGKLPMVEEGLTELARGYLPKLKIHSGYDELGETDIFVLCLPSPIDDNKRPITDYLESSLSSIAAIIRHPVLVIIESTVPVGFTERQAHRFSKIVSLTHDEEFWFVHSPERVLPGSVVCEMEENDRLVGGVTERATELGHLFLGSVFGENKIHRTRSKISETSKLAENAYRDTCIAFANELALLSTEIGIDVREVIHFANLHPRVDILEPGLGVGGYCFPKDGWILVNSTEGTKKLARLIPTARSVNDTMPSHVLHRIKTEMDSEYLAITRFAILGVSYKPNVSDTRMSPSLELISLLRRDGKELRLYDPLVRSNSDLKLSKELGDVVDSCDVIVFAVNHSWMKDALLKHDLSDKIVVDPTGSLQEERDRFRKYIGLTA